MKFDLEKMENKKNKRNDTRTRQDGKGASGCYTLRMLYVRLYVIIEKIVLMST